MKMRRLCIPAFVICLSLIAPVLATAADGKYTVKEGDTLGAIARAHGVSIDTLSQLNGLDDPNRLSVGQVLLVPGASAVRAVKQHYALPSDLKRRLDSQRVVRGKWRYIVVHHSGTANGNVRGMDLYHRQKRHMENGLAYHFVIGNGRGMKDGEIAIGNRWKRQIKGGHLASDAQNQVSIGICLVGNFGVTRPTSQQLRNLYALIQYLEERCFLGAKAVKTHRQINVKPTECPGRNFPTKALMDNV